MVDTAIVDAQTMGTMCFFSAPQWSWKKAMDTFKIEELHNKVEIALAHAKGYDVSESLIDIPSDFIRFYTDFLKGKSSPEPNWDDVHFKLTQDGKRYLFTVVYLEVDEGEYYDLPLWYWVPSNLPKWAKNGKHIRRVREH